MKKASQSASMRLSADRISAAGRLHSAMRTCVTVASMATRPNSTPIIGAIDL